MSPALNYRAYSNWSLAINPFFSSSKVFLMVYFVGVCPDFSRPEDVNKFVSAPLIFLLALELKLLRVNLWGPQLKAIVL